MDEDGAQWELDDAEVDVEDLEYVSDSDEDDEQGPHRRSVPEASSSTDFVDGAEKEGDGHGPAAEESTSGDIEQLALSKKIPLSHQVRKTSISNLR